MTDATGHKNRPGAGPYSNDMLVYPLGSLAKKHSTKDFRLESCRSFWFCDGFFSRRKRG
jgi:hypothetical protein